VFAFSSPPLWRRKTTDLLPVGSYFTILERSKKSGLSPKI